MTVHLDQHHDDRGWFSEVWHAERMTDLGDFTPVQANIAWNERRGTTRGLHAEPWDKLVTLASGTAFGAWVDLRPDNFGTVHTLSLEPGLAVLVPQGVANGYQTTADDTAYVYLVTDHWRPDAKYVAVNYADPALGIDWPIGPLDRTVSFKDMTAPTLAHVDRRKPCLGSV